MIFLQRFLMVLFVPFLLVFTSEANAAGVAEFKRIKGVVDVFHAGERKSIPALKGMSLIEGDTVRTGRRSRAQLKFIDGSTMNIGSLAKIKIGEYSYDAESKVRKSSIRNLRGKLRAVVSKSDEKSSYFRVQTPGAVAAVRGTTFGVDYSGGTTTVMTTEGSVAVAANLASLSKPGGAVLVGAGQISFVLPGAAAPTLPVAASVEQMGAMNEGTRTESSSSSGSSSDSAGESDGGTTDGGGTDGGTTDGGTTDGGTTDGGAAASSTTTETSGTTTTEGTTTTTTTTTKTESGSSSVSSTSTTSAPASSSAAPVPVVVAPTIAAPKIVIPTPPVIPVTKSVPTITNVNVVIQF